MRNIRNAEVRTRNAEQKRKLATRLTVALLFRVPRSLFRV